MSTILGADGVLTKDKGLSVDQWGGCHTVASVIQRIRELSVEYPIPVRIFAVVAVLSLVGLSYFGWLRPYQLNWGASRAEVEASMAGDELDPDPSFRATRAITIAAPPEEVWPWLVQMGYGRAGLYADDLLENAGSQRGIRSADEILPEFQGLGEGDEVPISAVVSMRFHAIEPRRWAAWGGTGWLPAGPVLSI